jgi:pyridoxamine 5'-phosphate oxidase
MNLSECTKFANQIQACSIATNEGDQPRVRTFAMWYADDTGFYFHTGGMKPVCKQLKGNPKTEVCFWAPGSSEGDPGTMLRVAGKVEFVDDRALKARLLEERPFLKDMGIDSPDNPALVVFRIPHGEAYFWNMSINMHEAEAERVKF